MKRHIHEADGDQTLHEALARIRVFLAIVLAERSGPLTPHQRDFLESAMTAATQAEQQTTSGVTDS